LGKPSPGASRPPLPERERIEVRVLERMSPSFERKFVTVTGRRYGKLQIAILLKFAETSG
jgi:hypothetical protein